MYALAKQLIVEKDLQRKITILENLISHPILTTGELAKRVGVSQRTIFNDLQDLRLELPEEWLIEADGNTGVYLKAKKATRISDVWEFYMKESLTMQVLKQLLVRQTIRLTDFLAKYGVSAATLKRQIKKMNQVLKPFQLKIEQTSTDIYWVGEETAIRIFYHRLLLPFTYDHFFFEEHVVNKENYLFFLRRLERSKRQVDTEIDFGVCWFFINTVRIKSNCKIEQVVHVEDALFVVYQEEIRKLYLSEGISLKEDELFFAFFCFLESWNFSLPKSVKQLVKTEYQFRFSEVKQFLMNVTQDERLANDEQLIEECVLFLIKYYESASLADKFLLEYAEVLSITRTYYRQLVEKVSLVIDAGYLLGEDSVSEAMINSLVLLIQTAKMKKQLEQVSCYFIYQGEPLWKHFLLQELRDLVGSRVVLVEKTSAELKDSNLIPGDFILSNVSLPLDEFDEQIPTFFISTLPSHQELAEVKEYIATLYL